MADIPEIFLRTVLTVGAIVLLTRLNGLRSFSKMSAFDFAITVATGSVLAGTILNPSKSLLFGLAALASLFVVQFAITRLRVRTNAAPALVDNTPLLIMEDGAVLERNLRAAGMTMADLRGKLREANALDLSLVRAVVFESTGDVSVLHAGSEDERLDPALLEGVRR